MSSRGGWFGVLGVVVLLSWVGSAWGMSPRYARLGDAQVVEVESANLLRIKLEGSGKQMTVRLLGVGSPRNRDRLKNLDPELISYIERNDLWEKARNFVRSRLEGKKVEIWARRQDRLDDKKRLLVYVVLQGQPDEASYVNGEIIKRGFGFVTRDYVHVTFADYKRLEREARDNRLGMWRGAPMGRVSSLGR